MPRGEAPALLQLSRKPQCVAFALMLAVYGIVPTPQASFIYFQF
jgi:hypothetical protein